MTTKIKNTEKARYVSALCVHPTQSCHAIKWVKLIQKNRNMLKQKRNVFMIYRIKRNSLTKVSQELRVSQFT